MTTILILLGIALLVLLAVLFGPMILLWIFLGIVALITLIFLTPVTVDIKLKDELTVYLKIWFVKIKLTPKKIFINFGLKLLAVSIGAIIYYMVVQFVVSVLAINTNYLKLFSALIVAVFLAVPYWKQEYFHQKRKEGHHA